MTQDVSVFSSPSS